MTEDLLGDTIAAIATAPGRSAVALVRVAGPDATTVLGRVAASSERLSPRVQRLLPIRHPETSELVDRALVTYFPAPASYTGDDVVEISTHGGLLTPQLVLAAVLAAGARAALPGEFTRRAYLNGKLDLLQAEAILDLIDGHSPALHRAAVFQLDRGLSTRIEELRHAILGVEALLVYTIDFPEEDEPPVPPQRITGDATGVIERISRLLATAPEGEMLREGALVVLAGRPNSGKSSLFNALIGAERAIVTDVPGTTRDALEAQITIDGYPFRLVDTAGLRETADRVEGIGIEVARRFLRAARTILFCAPAGRPLDSEEGAFLDEFDQVRVVRVRTMADLGAGEPQPRVPGDEGANDPEIVVSAVTGHGLERLRRLLLAESFGEILDEPGEAPIVTRERHARALRLARDEVGAFVTAMEAGIPMEIGAVHLRSAVGHLEEVIGGVTTEDLLGRVFGDFCVGK